MASPSTHHLSLDGAFTAIVTPFNTDGTIDFGRLRANIQWQGEQGIDGVVPVGTTGESPTLDYDEHVKVIEVAVDASRLADGSKMLVIAGTGSNGTEEALELTKKAKHVGADITLQVNPYYNKPSQEGLYRHFARIADEGGLPVMLYNIPGRSAVKLNPETVKRLGAHANIIAIKEATGSIDNASAAVADTDMAVLSGDDSLTLPIMAVGGCGVVSVISNLLPARVKAMVDAANGGDFAAAREIHLELFGLCRAMLSLDVNPVPVKTAMQLLGRDTGVMRLPLCEISDEGRAKLESLLAEANLAATV